MGQTSRRRTSRMTADDPFWDLVATARRLQAPGGCPWDRAQTVTSLLPHLIEETWEVFDSVRGRRLRELQEELGDVLYTALFLTLIAERRGWLTLSQLLRATRKKMIRRHPHVFGGTNARTPREAYAHWQAAKRQERTRPSRSKSLRPLLVAVWDLVRREPEAVRELEQLLARRRRATRQLTGGGPRQRSARSLRTRVR